MEKGLKKESSSPIFSYHAETVIFHPETAPSVYPNVHAGMEK